MKQIIYLSIFMALVMFSCGTTPILIDFNDLSLLSAETKVNPNPHQPQIGEIFKVGDILEVKKYSVKIVVVPFRWPDHVPPLPDQWTPDGYVEIVSSSMAGGTGNEIHFNNACLGVDVPPDSLIVKKIILKFADLGGNINLFANGKLSYSDDFDQIPPIWFSNVNVLVIPGGPKGILHLTGSMKKFSFTFPFPPIPPGFPFKQYSAVIGGGQELWIDDLEIHE